MIPANWVRDAATVAVVLAIMLDATDRAQAAKQRPPVSSPSTLVLAEPGDAYYPLAEEIAAKEGIEVVHSIEEAFHAAPVFLLWVASPSQLSADALVQYGLTARDRSTTISMGIITGSSLKSARALWLRRTDVSGEELVLAGPDDQISVHHGGVARAMPFSAANLQHVLRIADYLVYAGHGAPRSWQELRGADVPDLRPVVVEAASCQNLQPWLEGNIALTFVERGAAAYAGFPSSPVGDFRVGRQGGMPMRQTWPDCPIGHVVQIQARGAMRVFARFPQYFLLGDPRISLQASAPYTLAGDELRAGVRTLTLAGATAGVVPVRIPGGAKFGFVEVPGTGAISRGDTFFNSRLEMADIGEDKYLLIDQAGDQVRILLHPGAPLDWRIRDTLLDSLDLTLPSRADDKAAALMGGVIGLVLAAWRVWRKRSPPRIVAAAAAGALGITVLLVTFVHLRYGEASVRYATLDVDVPLFLGMWFLTGSGMLLFVEADSRRGEALGLLVCLFPGWIVPLIALPLGFLTSIFGRGPAYVHSTVQSAQSLWVALEAIAMYAALTSLKKSALPRLVVRDGAQSDG